MPKWSRRALLIVLGTVGAPLMTAPMTAAALAQAGSVKGADGLTVYLGVIPAEMIKGHPAEHPESTMHRESRRGPHSYHVMVAIFDTKTGERVTGVTVSARVSEAGLSGAQKPLERMQIADTTSYGNYFDMTGSSHYRIAVEIDRTDAPKPTWVIFDYVPAPR